MLNNITLWTLRICATLGTFTSALSAAFRITEGKYLDAASWIVLCLTLGVFSALSWAYKKL